MPRTKRPKPLYQRGKFRLDRRPDREQLVVTWYDPTKRRERSISAGTGDVAEARKVVDRLFLESEGTAICPTCGQPTQGAESPLLTQAIVDYLVNKENHPSYKALRARLAHVLDYLDTLPNGKQVRGQHVDSGWVERFREWMIDRPIVSPSGKERKRAIGTIENSVVALAAAINLTDQRGARFTALPPKEVNQTPTLRLDVDTLARMFAYAIEPKKRRDSLLAFIRFTVLTLARPDAALEATVGGDRKQWDAQHRVYNLNPKNRRQTKKYRPIVPVARQGVVWLNSIEGPIVKANTVKTAWNKMVDDLGLPRGEGETGTKLLRRSMADLLRSRMLSAHWPELEAFLGHKVFSDVSALYAPARPDYLGHAKAAIEAVIDDVEKLVGEPVYGAVTAQVAPEGVRFVA